MSIGLFPIGTVPIGVASVAATNYNNTLSDNAVSSSALINVYGQYVTVADTGYGHTATPLSLITAVLLNNAVAGTTTSTSQGMKNALTDTGYGHDKLIVAFANLITDTAHAHDSLDSVYSQIAQLVDIAIAHGLVVNVLDAKNLIVDTATALDSLQRTWPVLLSDTGYAHDLAASLLAMNAAVVDNAVAHTTESHVISVTFAVTDNAVAHETLASQLAANELLQDNARAIVTFALNGEAFTGVVLNAETAGVSEYTNFPFNSMDDFNGKAYGCADDGIYVLEGSTDAGTAIDAHIRTGLMRMSDGIRTRIPEAYIGYKSNGDVVLKVITTSPQGQKIENWYKLQRRTANAPRETRTKIGKGLVSVYWQFELANINGADLELDTLQLLPIVLERRV